MDICSGEIMKIWKFIGTLLNIIKIAVPILLIVMGSIDFMKAVMAGKDDEIKKSQGTFVKRAIAAVIVFFVPTIVGILLSLINETKSSCLTCVLNTSTCNVSSSGGSGNTGNTGNSGGTTDSTENNVSSDSFCSQFTGEDECNQNSNQCEWKYLGDYNLNVDSNNGNYCVNKYFEG